VDRHHILAEGWRRCLDSGGEQQILDHRLQTIRRPVRSLEEVAPIRIRELHLGRQEGPEVSLDARERRPQLVRDGREEVVLQGADLGLVRQRALELPDQLRVSDRDGHVVGDRLEQFQILLVERAEVAHAVGHHECPQQLVVRLDRHDDGVDDPLRAEEASQTSVADRA
jgi:hypothetical protein